MSSNQQQKTILPPSGSIALTPWGPDQADHYTDDIRKIYEALATGEKCGVPVDVRIGYLKRQTGPHMLYFRDLGDVIVIVRILHRMCSDTFSDSPTSAIVSEMPTPVFMLGGKKCFAIRV